eukprot:TRINITY_DN4436_c0_g1_i3.p1 TRINITY_DN4436_c0_g1~~TRINITY_DN4436_c0_g1_i3.p1  ORF type:complete len:211 (+),score=18.97 TRINITY_DN4436_c0_g1_i3:429-1061(+)
MSQNKIDEANSNKLHPRGLHMYRGDQSLVVKNWPLPENERFIEVFGSPLLLFPLMLDDTKPTVLEDRISNEEVKRVLNRISGVFSPCKAIIIYLISCMAVSGIFNLYGPEKPLFLLFVSICLYPIYFGAVAIACEKYIERRVRATINEENTKVLNPKEVTLTYQPSHLAWQVFHLTTLPFDKQSNYSEEISQREAVNTVSIENPIERPLL